MQVIVTQCDFGREAAVAELSASSYADVCEVDSALLLSDKRSVAANNRSE